MAEFGDGCLIGMGSTIMNGAKIGAGSVVGANALVMTSLGDTWTAIQASSLEQVRAFLNTRFFGPVLDPLLTGLLGFPGFAVLGVPGIVLALLGRSKRARHFVKQDQF